jgi:hypothetical protein
MLWSESLFSPLPGLLTFENLSSHDLRHGLTSALLSEGLRENPVKLAGGRNIRGFVRKKQLFLSTKSFIYGQNSPFSPVK